MFKFKIFFICILLSIFCLQFLVYSAEPIGYASISGYVTDSVTGQSLVGSIVKVKVGSVTQEMTVDSSGYYNFSSFPIYKTNNKTKILVIAENFKTKMQKVTLVDGQSYTFNFSLTPRFKYPVVTGVVTDQSVQPIADATVIVSNATESYFGTTDALGVYAILVMNRKVGEYDVVASAQNYIDSEPINLQTYPDITYTLDFALTSASLSVRVTPDFWDVGAIAPYSVVTMADVDKITVINDGSSNATYSLNVVSPDNWQVSQTEVDANTYILNAAFSQDLNNINWNDVNHALSHNLIVSSELQFSGDQTGVDVLPEDERTLWLQFKAPTSTQITTQQSIEVIITAQSP